MAPPRIREHLGRLYPDHRVLSIEALGPDSASSHDATAKAAGYGLPVRVSLATPDGTWRELVWHVSSANQFGHDRRSDRAASALLAFDDYAQVPSHVRAHDVGAIRGDGELISLRECGELYLLTDYAPGTIYAEDLRRIARGGATDRDRARVDTLAGYLATLHVPIVDPVRYRRSVRDVVGHGEGIFGMMDSFRADIPGATLARLHEIEKRCVTWRWRMREHEDRLCRTHGDFHPFNVVFDGERLALLDASRGACGDPADDVTAMAINYILFALDSAEGWTHLGPLWHQFWASYQRRRPDRELASVAPLYFAWRALVVCNPVFYPGLEGAARSALLGLVETALDANHLDPAWADELFR